MGLKKNKSWVLLADYYDDSKLLNYSGFMLSSMMENIEWTPSTHHVLVFVNNQFQGLYLLTDQVDEKKDEWMLNVMALLKKTNMHF